MCLRKNSSVDKSPEVTAFLKEIALVTVVLYVKVITTTFDRFSNLVVM